MGIEDNLNAEGLRVEIIPIDLENIISKIKIYAKDCWKAYVLDASKVSEYIPELFEFSNYQMQTISRKAGKAIDIIKDIPHDNYKEKLEYFITPDFVERTRILDYKDGDNKDKHVEIKQEI